MRGLDYRSVVAQRPEADSKAGAYVLEMGSVRLDPISYETLLALQERASSIEDALNRCFVDKPVMWAERESENATPWLEQLREIEVGLAEVTAGFEASDRPCDRVLTRIFEFWRELTGEVVREIQEGAGSELGSSTESVLAGYRRSAFACVEALVQLLPDQDPCSIETRYRLEEGISRVAGFLHVAPDRLHDATWQVGAADRYTDDPAFVTWGIP